MLWEAVFATCKVLLERLPVKDFAVEEVPIEDIIRQVFERRSDGTCQLGGTWRRSGFFREMRRERGSGQIETRA